MKEIHAKAKANVTHTHTQSDIAGLADALSGMAGASHTHAQSDITGLTTALSGKANSSHTHAQSDITNLTTTLAAKAPLASPTFTGTPKAPTAAAGNNTTQVATTAFVTTAVSSKQATVTGAATTITSSDLTASRALVSNSNGKVAVSAVTATELGYLDGVTSNIQTQLNGKQAAISGTANAVMITDANGKPTVSGAITVQELNYLNNASSNIQTQINGKIGYPNWSQTPTNVTLYNGLTFTPTKNGYFMVNSVGGSQAQFKVGNVPFYLAKSDTVGENYVFLPVQAGTVITSLDSETENVVGRYRWIDAL